MDRLTSEKAMPRLRKKKKTDGYQWKKVGGGVRDELGVWD